MDLRNFLKIKELIPVWGMAVFFGMLLSYPITVASGAMLFLAEEFTMNAFEKSGLVGFVLIGTLFGIALGGLIADRYGRKKSLVLASFFLCVGSFFSIWIHSFKELLFFRWITGVGIGISSMVVPIYLAEVSLPRYRGRLVSLFQVAITVGIFISYVTNLCLLRSHNWRIAFVVSAIFSICSLFFVLTAKESLVWLEKKGKTVTFRDLFQGGLRKALIVGVFLSIFQQITGINVIVCFAPEIFHHAGLTDLCDKLIATTCLGGLNVATALFTMTQIDNWGRRKLLLIGIPFMVITLLFLAFFFSNSVVAVVNLFFYLLFFGISLGPIVWVITAEIFPLEVRGKAVAISLFINWATSLFISFAFLYLVEWISIENVFLLFSVMSLLAFFFIYKFVPETKGKTLEDIQEYWKK